MFTRSVARRTLASLVLLALSAAALSAQIVQPPAPETLTPVPTRDQKIVRRWQLAGDPRGVALGRDGTIYVGLAQPQAVIAVDPKSGAIRSRLVLDSAEIASTKELVTLRTNRDATRLYIANGSDESATILGLPDLHVIREITLEGETIRDAIPDPKGRYIYLLGRRVHVYDATGEQEIKTIDFADPMAIAAAENGATLAILGPEDFGGTKATVVAVYDTTTFAELARDPMQTDQVMEGALFADQDRALVAVSRDHLFEKPIVAKAAPKKLSTSYDGQMRMTINFGDLVNSNHVCLPEGSGPQIAVQGPGNLLIFAERRCSASGSFAGSSRRVTPASLYGVDAYAIAFDAASNTLVATDRAGYLTIYKGPRAAVAK